MPTHTIHSALTQMYFTQGYSGAPWIFPAWQELTGVRNGLFHDDDSKLPSGWTRQTAKEISSYFDQFRALLKEEEKIKFSSMREGSQMVPGREAWKEWVTKLWKKAKVHEKIIQVFAAQEMHPYRLKQGEDSWPDASIYVPLLIDSVGLELFGEEAFSTIPPIVHFKLRNSTKAITTRSWITLNTNLARKKKNLSALEAEATQAFEDLDRDELTKAKIKTVIVKVVRWKEVVENLMIEEEKIEVMEEELTRLMGGLGVQVKGKSERRPSVAPATKSKSLSRVTDAMLKTLASEGDVADILNLYTDCFNPTPRDSSELSAQVPTIDFDFGTGPGGADPGIGIEAALSPESLSKNLGFRDRIPILFNTHRHKGGATQWDDRAAFHNFSSSPDFARNELHWHQLAGVHAILRRLLTKQASSLVPGILVADEVGLGKTLQSLATIAWLTECVGRQKRGGILLSPMYAQNPFLGDSKTFPDRPHLILVPGTILGQWESAIKTFLSPKAFDLFVYHSGDKPREQFWSETEGPYKQSIQPPSNRVILATHSALMQDKNLLFSMRKSSPRELPWDKLKRNATYDASVKKTLFGLDYLSATIDEAHEYRNVGPKHLGALAILKQAKIRIAMTATPLQTSTKDLSSIGRLVGIPYFSTKEALDEEKADIAELRRVKVSLGDDYDPLENLSDSEDPIREAQVTIAQRIQGQFQTRVLRRTTDSKDWRGQDLLTLPKLHEHTVLLTLQPFEQDIHKQIGKKLQEDLSSCSAMKAFSSTFYLRSRLGATYPRLNLTDKIPRFKTMDEWQKAKSTKVDVLARMCLHLLSRDDAPPMVFKDGDVVFPPVAAPAPGEQISQKMKIIVYQEFPSFGPMVRDVFSLYDIKNVYMDGHCTYNARMKILTTFDDDPSVRVMIFSSVGACGLNLSKASTVIFLDQPWSAQDERQIRGRAHRQPQDKEVNCYHLLADETSDVVLAALARGKKDMMETFLTKPEGQEMLDLMTTGISPAIDNSPIEDIDPPVQKKAGKMRKRKSVVIEEVRSSPDPIDKPDLTSAPSTPPITPPPPSRRPNAGKRRERPPTSPGQKSPDSPLHKKRAKLVFYESSPEKDSDIEMLDHDPLLSWSAAQSDDTLPATTASEMERDEISSNAEEFSSMNISSTGPDEISSREEPQPRKGRWRQIAPPSNDDSEEDERPAVQQREKTIPARPSHLAKLVEAKLATARPSLSDPRPSTSTSTSIAGPSRYTSVPEFRRPTLLRKLSPPPRKTVHQNPFTKGKKKADK